MSREDAVQISDVHLTRGSTRILTQLTMSATPGEITAVLGPNGAGKTTLFRCCTAVMSPERGTIRVLGRPAGHPENRAKVGWMPQTPGSWSGATPTQFLQYLSGLYTHPHSPKELLQECGLSAVSGTAFRRLSGGQKQALNLAAALIGRPELVILDEPTAGMDPHARRHTWDLLDRLTSSGVTVIMATHDMTEAQRAAHIHILDHGTVRLSGKTQDLTAHHSLEEVFLTHTSDQRQT